MTRIDNATGFAEKMQRVVEAISKHLSVDEGERADAQTPAKKHKFIVTKWPEVRYIIYMRGWVFFVVVDNRVIGISCASA